MDTILTSPERAVVTFFVIQLLLKQKFTGQEHNLKNLNRQIKNLLYINIDNTRFHFIVLCVNSC